MECAYAATDALRCKGRQDGTMFRIRFNTSAGGFQPPSGTPHDQALQSGRPVQSWFDKGSQYRGVRRGGLFAGFSVAEPRNLARDHPLSQHGSSRGARDAGGQIGRVTAAGADGAARHGGSAPPAPRLHRHRPFAELDPHNCKKVQQDGAVERGKAALAAVSAVDARNAFVDATVDPFCVRSLSRSSFQCARVQAAQSQRHHGGG